MSIWLKKFPICGAIFLASLLFAAAPALSAPQKVSDLTALTGANTATADVLLIVDTDVTTSKKITRDELAIGLGGPMAIVVESTPGTAPTATGTDAIGMGDTAVAGDAAGDNGVLAIGANATATGGDSIAIGENADATADNAIAIGGNSTDATSADATSAGAIALGSNTLADNGNAVAIGNGADAGGSDSVAVGFSTNAAGGGSVALGNSSSAAGTAAISIGISAGTGDSGIAIGQNTDATNCIAIGGNSTDADSANCTAADAVAIGQNITADDIGEFAFASGDFVSPSDAHTSIFVLRNNTTDATQTELFADGSSGDISVPSDCTVTFHVFIVARQTDADDVSAGYSFFGVMDNNAGTTALVGSLSAITTIGEDVAGWDVTATADDTNDGINVLVTGAVGDAVRWVARAEIVEVCG